VFANEIHDAPTAIALLDVSESECHFGSPQEATAQETGYDGALSGTNTQRAYPKRMHREASPSNLTE